MAIPLPLRGIDVTLAQVTIQSVSGSGVLTDSATVGTITAVLAGAGIRSRMETEEISAITSPRLNNVPLQHGVEVVLREILDRRASSLPSTGPVLAQLSTTLQSPGGSPYAKIVLTRGGNTITVKGIFSSYDEGPYTKGANIGEMTFLPIDDGTDYYSYA